MNSSGLRHFVSPLYRIAIIALPLIFLTQCRISKDPGAGADPQDYLPLDNDISGYVKKGSVSLMTDQQSIFNAIDGAAQSYITYGFEEGVVQLYSNGSVDINVEIFNQGTQPYAQSLYNYFMPTSPQILSQNNPAVVVDLSQATSYTHSVHQAEHIHAHNHHREIRFCARYGKTVLLQYRQQNRRAIDDVYF